MIRKSLSAAWSGEYVWKRNDSKVYEYACHEGNYAMGNMLRGAGCSSGKHWQPRSKSVRGRPRRTPGADASRIPIQ